MPGERRGASGGTTEPQTPQPPDVEPDGVAQNVPKPGVRAAKAPRRKWSRCSAVEGDRIRFAFDPCVGDVYLGRTATGSFCPQISASFVDLLQLSRGRAAVVDGRRDGRSVFVGRGHPLNGEGPPAGRVVALTSPVPAMKAKALSQAQGGREPRSTQPDPSTSRPLLSSTGSPFLLLHLEEPDRR